MHTIYFNVTVSGNDDQSHAAQPTRQVNQEVERVTIRPVEVFESDHQRLDGCRALQEITERLIQPPAILLGIVGDAWFHGNAIAQLGQEASDLRRISTQL